MRTSEGWAGSLQCSRLFSAEDCVGCQGSQGSLWPIFSLPCLPVNLFLPQLSQSKAGQWDLGLTSTLLCQERLSTCPAFFLSRKLV